MWSLFNPFRPFSPETLIQVPGRNRIPARALFHLRLTWEFGLEYIALQSWQSILSQIPSSIDLGADLYA
ncbi:hypothetical protein GV64_03395 [Endozoicomonas elysicola]|uniref:Uncharacterized protein n=1 Tax=Endozoicomonas elysicola TaxID=305900 RepID=A0A081K6Y8_9GAMM|nr:hypothetical protein GV64_03395 [Endozoicomonas elysicola]